MYKWVSNGLRVANSIEDGGLSIVVGGLGQKELMLE